MRIGWATPINVRSAIGKYSVFACSELRHRGHGVDIIRTETGPELELDALPCDLRIVDADRCSVDDYDVLVMNFGNHAPYHAGMLPLLAKRAPVGILHDIELRHFEWGLLQRHGMALPRLTGIELDASQPSGDLVDPAARPLLATCAAMTSGAVIHGPHYLSTVSAYCPGPVHIIPLCFPDVGTGAPAPSTTSALRVTIFGHINEHKQPRRVLKALASIRPDTGPVELHLAGEIEDHYRASLEEQAFALQIDPPVFHGYVSDGELQAILDGSSAICCLRYPVTEGSSASLATALYRARPLIISDIASFSIVPDDLAYKVSYGTDPEDVAAALRTIFADPEEAAQRAARGSDWAHKRFSAAAYIDALEPLLMEAPALEQSARAARELIPPLLAPNGQRLMPAVKAFSGVLDWMAAAQSN